jgi:hypothetical protein
MIERADNIVIQTETPGEWTSLFRVAIGRKVIAERLTAAQAHILVGNILEQLVQPKRASRGSLLASLNESHAYLRAPAGRRVQYQVW